MNNLLRIDLEKPELLNQLRIVCRYWKYLDHS